MRFSVIIPVYKVENYIEKCIESVLKQDFEDYEVLLVDDGSPDNCGLICDKYAELYSNIKTFHKENGGLSDARNYGLEHAKGEYIIFIDSDDWIEEGCFRAFDEAIGLDHPDVLETTLIEAYSESSVKKDVFFEEYLKEPITRERAVNWACNISENTWPAQKKIYAMSFLKKNDLKFPKDRLHEDMDWTSRVLYAASIYKGCAYPWYYHRMERQGSITNTISAKNITDVIEMARIHYGYLQERNDDLHKIVFSRIMRSVYSSINLCKKCSAEDRELVINCIAENRAIFNITPEKRHKLFVFIMKVMGVRTAINLLHLS